MKSLKGESRFDRYKGYGDTALEEKKAWGQFSGVSDIAMVDRGAMYQDIK